MPEPPPKTQLRYLMPSKLKRFQTGGSYYFIAFSCYRRLPYLDNGPARVVFEEELEKLRSRHQFYVFGYVLMPNHVHLLVSEPKSHILATTLNVLKAETSKRLKGERKQFWQTRYYDFNVHTADKQAEKLRYMHRNPVVRGLVEKPEDWAWGSFRHYLTGEVGRIEIESHWTYMRRERALCTPPIRMKPRVDGAPGDHPHPNRPHSHPTHPHEAAYGWGTRRSSSSQPSAFSPHPSA